MIVYQGAAAAKRVYRVLDKEIKTVNSENLPKIQVIKGKIKFENVSFNYLNTKSKAVRNINIEIPGGSRTAFVGHSGAGKSTIINLLPRFYEPQNGKIYLDDQDILKFSLNSLREKISLVSQDVVLFDGTIKNNVAYAN